jgi:hypothetical protein
VPLNYSRNSQYLLILLKICLIIWTMKIDPIIDGS